MRETGKKHHFYTKEQKEWLIDNINTFETRTEGLNAFNEKFGLNITRDALNSVISKSKYIDTDPKKLKEEHIEWIRENLPKYKTKVSCYDAFVKEFGMNVSITCFNKVCSDKLSDIKITYLPDGITDEHLEWLKENSYKYNSYQALGKDFNEKFGLGIHYIQIYRVCRDKVGCSTTNKKRAFSERNKWCGEKEVEWMINKSKEYGTNFKGAYAEFMKTFDMKISYQCFYEKYRKLTGLRSRDTRRTLYLKSEEELNWIKNNIHNYKLYTKCYKDFLKEFGFTTEDVKYEAFYLFCTKKLGLSIVK